MALEELSPDHPDHDRVKRSLDDFNDISDDDDMDSHGHVVIYESAASGGECGIKEKNREKMRAPKTATVVLKGEKESRNLICFS